MVTTTVISNTIIVIILFFFIAVYSIDFTIPYPRVLFTYFQLPAVKIMLYMFLYIVAYYNPIVSLLLLIIIVMLHLNETLFVKRDKSQ